MGSAVVPTPSGTTKDEVAAPAGAPPSDPAPAQGEPADFSAQLGALRADQAGAIPAAVELFGKAFSAEAGSTNPAERHRALRALLGFIGRAIEPVDDLMTNSPAMAAATCRYVGRCDAGEPTAAAIAMVETLSRAGVRFVYAGEGTVTVEPDYPGLADRLGATLSPSDRDYLEAMTWEADKVTSTYDEGGFFGNPDDIAEALGRWEALAAMDPAVRATEAQEHATRLAERYLTLCGHELGARPACVVDRRLRASYRRFVRERTGSAYRPAVQHWLRELEARRFRTDIATMQKLADESLAHTAATDP